MTKILLCDCRILTEQETYEKAYRMVSVFRQKKADAYKAEMDRARCIGAGLLLREAFFSCGPDEGGGSDGNELLPASEITVESLLETKEPELEAVYREIPERADARGRSYLEGEGSLWKGAFLTPYVSISHSGDLAAVAFSHQPVGLDIQNRRRFTEGMVRKVLSPSENAKYQSLAKNSKESADDFLLSLWCQKEAAAKLDGRGIFAMLSELAADDWKVSQGINIQTFEVRKGYAGAIAYR